MNKILYLIFLIAFVSSFQFSFSQDEQVNGSLHVSGNIEVDGNLKVSGQRVHRYVLSLAGQADQYYPVYFRDPSWYYGEMVLQIYRPRVHTDKQWHGSLMARFTSHATSWGHGADFIDASIRQSRNQFIADYQNSRYSNGIIVWLKGQTTYFYHSNGRPPAVTYNDTGDGKIIGRVYQGSELDVFYARSTVEDSLSLDGSKLSDNLHVEGKVGIGIANPESRLEVAGRIRAEEVVVESAWADYVFADDYELSSLKQVAAFIDANGRLPGVPSAEEVSANGISIGDSQRVLLEKIEELTLYAIEADRRLEIVKKQLAERDSIIADLSDRMEILEAR